MNSFMLTMLLNLLRAAPSLATDLEAAAKSAESPEALDVKIKDVIGDLGKALAAIESVL